MAYYEDQTESRTGLEIAVVGMAARFPGAKDINEFWDNLLSGKETIKRFTDEELRQIGVSDNIINNPNYMKVQGMLADKDKFDPLFFGFTPAEARLMSPQMRIMHECVWNALEHSGYNPLSYKGEIGLYAGTSSTAHWSALSSISNMNKNAGAFASNMLTDKDKVCTQISYNLNLKGPSFVLQTACSTSLVAIHLACQGLISGECSMALAGGLSLSTTKEPGYIFMEGSIYSADGCCRPFDENANGTVESEGVGVVVLKTLEDAIEDGDTIHAIISGSAINNDGNRKVGYTAPSVEGQAKVIRAAHQAAEIDPETISYIETHGTGTNMGDPIEIEALKWAFNSEKKGFCKIGSVKSNIGHTIEAAGVASLIKTVLSLKNKKIPPTLHIKKPNPKIDFENSPFILNTKVTDWKENVTPLRAGVSSFGIGGTNAHVVLEEPPLRKEKPAIRKNHLICLSAKTKKSLQQKIDDLADFLKDNRSISLADLAYTLFVGRDELNMRKTFYASNIEGAIKDLTSKEALTGFTNVKNAPSVCFMFSGQGAQYVQMAYGLYQTEPVFKQELQKCFDIVKELSGIDLEQLIFALENLEEASSRLKQTEITQPALFVIEYAVARFLIELGIKPDYLIGHSIGEYVAACIAGVFSLKDAIKIVLLRGKLMQQTQKGSMLSIPLNEENLNKQIDENISIAAINTPGQVVVSGTDEAIKDLHKKMESQNIKCISLHTSHAFHSYLMDPILQEFDSLIAKIEINKPTIPFISNITGQVITNQQLEDPSYWSKHIRMPVRFAAGLETLMKQSNAVFIEVGPGKSLCSFVQQSNSKTKEHNSIHLIKHPKESVSDESCFWGGIGNIWSLGLEVNKNKIYEGEHRFRIPLPVYPFERNRFWIDEEISDYLTGKSKEGSFEDLLIRTDQINDWFYAPSWEQTPLYNTVSQTSHGVTILFADSVGISDSLMKEISTNDSKLIVVKKNTAFAKTSDYDYELNPQKIDDFDNLIDNIISSGLQIENVIHCWNIYNENKTDIEVYDDIQDNGFYSIISLVQALGKKGVKEKISIKVISNNIHDITGNEVYLSPEKATLLGAVKVVPLEYTNIYCKSIDIDLPKGSIAKDNNIIKNLASELNLVSNEIIVAIRGNNRWIPGVRKLNFENNKELPVFKEKGVYLITGGFGGLGFSFATHIAEKYNASLILVDRKEVPDRKDWGEVIKNSSWKGIAGNQLEKMIELERNGARFMPVKVDISNYQEMSKVVQNAEKYFGKINGVIHTAGVIDFEGVIQNRTREMTELSFAPKVKGALVLDKVFDGRNLDMFVLFSSVGTYIYKMKFGQVGYNAANNFLDAFTYYLRKKGVNSYTLNWSDWLEVGMSLESAKHTAKKEGRKFTYEYFVNEQSYAPISPNEGIEAFIKVVASGCPRVAINSCDLIGAVKYLDKYGAPTATASNMEELNFERPDLDTDFEAPGNQVEQLIIDNWCKLFGIKQIGIHDDFFELGGDSLKGMTFINSIIEIIGEVIHVSAIFEAPTASKFSHYLLENYPKSYAEINGEEIQEKDKVNSHRKVVDKELLFAAKKMIPEISKLETLSETRNKKAVFIISPPRTGSTLLRVMLAGHSGLFAPPELDLLSYYSLKQRKDYYSGISGTTSEGPIKAIMQIKNCDAEEARTIMKDMEDRGFTVQQFYHKMQEWIGNKILVDKSPGYSTNIEIIKRAELFFEDAIYIHLLRHPYGMIRSYDEAKLDLIEGTGLLKKLNLSRINLAELNWTIGNQNIDEFLKEIPNNRKYVLKFEDLVEDPKRIMEDLCEIIGIEFEDSVLKPYEEKNKRMTDGVEKGGLMIGDVKFHKHKGISKDVANSWKKVYKEDFLGEETILMANKYGYELINGNDFVPIKKTHKKDYYNLSSAQRRLFILQQIDGNRTEYNIFRSYHIKGKINKNKIEQAFKKLIERHESLRTSFHVHEGIPVQKVEERVEFSIQSFTAKEAEIEKMLMSFNSSIDIGKAPLIRVGLVKVNEDKHVLMANLHHIISDGTSIGLLMEEFIALYNGIDVPDVEIQYKDFAEWQKELSSSNIMKEKESYWLDKLSGELPVLNLPTDFNRPAVQTFEGSRINFTFSEELSTKIINLASSTGTTLYMLLLSIFKVLLGKYSGQDDIIVASPTTGRVQRCLEKTIGMFVNTLIIRSNPNPERTFLEYLNEIKKNSLEAFKNQDYQFEDLISKLNLKADLSRNALFDVMFAMQNLEQNTDFKIDNSLEIEPIDFYNNSSKFDITLNALEKEGKIEFIIEYCTKLFKKETIKRFINHFEQIAKQVVEDNSLLISDIQVISKKERTILLHDFNSTNSEYPEEVTIHKLFEEQTSKTPKSIAIYCGNENITYHELNEKSNKLASYIQAKSYKNELIGIIGHRKIELIIGILGILKSGNTYLPMDPLHPKERNDKILKESGAKLLLTNIADLVVEGVNIIQLEDSTIYDHGLKLEEPNVKSNDLAYVIYTSGSTGVPKGVMIEHRNLVNFVYGMKEIVPTNEGESLLSLTTVSFDIFGLELYVPLVTGMSMVLADSQHQYNSKIILPIVEQKNVKVIQLTPSRLKLMLSDSQSKEIFSYIHTILVGGEELPFSLHKELTQITSCKIFNMYGPTETTIWSTYKDISQGNELNIGKPIINTEIYILGSKMELQPIGVAGEMYISGAGISRGYYNNEDLTKERFIDHPYQPGTKLYKTGDLARWMPDGNIEFLGRLDHQVKIRGFRIELGEIETALDGHAKINESIVIARDDNDDKYLCAYLKISDQENINFREYLSDLIPDYMIPSYFVVLDEFPLTPNGKIDRKLLPVPEVKAGENYIGPSNEIEVKIVEIWSEVLNIPREEISVIASFFDLGGHSLKATNLIALIYKEFGYELSMADFYKKATILGISEFIMAWDWLNDKKSLTDIERQEITI